MLPFFPAAGRPQYAKGARLYLELMDKWAPKGSKLGDSFRVHTRVNGNWAGVWYGDRTKPHAVY